MNTAEYSNSERQSLPNEVRNLAREHGVAVTVFVMLATVFLADVLFQDKSLSAFDTLFYDEVWRSEYTIPDVYQHDLQDSPTAHYPQRRFDWDSLKQGHNPSINPYLFSGMYWMSEGVGAFVTSWPQLFLDTANAMDWTAWFHLVLAGLFMYFCTLQFGAGRLAAIFAGVVWTYNLHQVAWLEYPQHPGTQLWIPLLFGLNMMLLRKGFNQATIVALLIANVLFATSGYTQMVLFTFLLVGLFNSLYVVAVMQGTARERLLTWLKLHAIYVLAALLYSVNIFVQVDVLQEGLRGSQDWRGNLQTAELSLASFGEFLFRLLPNIEEIKRLYTPDYYGGIFGGDFVNEYSNTIEYVAYPGALCLLFGFYYLGRVGMPENRRLGALLLLCLGITWAAMYGIPFMVWVMQHIPFAGKGNYSRLMTLAVFLVALLSGLGLNQFMVDSPRRRWKMMLAAVLAMFAIPLLVHLLSAPLLLHKLWYALGICAVFLFVGFGAERLSGKKWVPAALAIGLLVADLFYVGLRFNTRLPNQLIFPENSTIRYLLQDPDIFRVAVASRGAGYHPNMLSFYQLPEIAGYSTVMSNRYRTFIREANPGVETTLNGIMTIQNPEAAVLRLLNVKYLVSIEQLEDPLLDLVFFANNNYLYRVRDWVPRIYCADYVPKYEESKFIPYDLDRWSGGSTLPAAVDIGVPFPEGPVSESCMIKDVQAFVNGLEATVTATGESLLVLGYAGDANWRALVDGQPTELYVVNGIFMGAILPQGAHSIRLVHRSGLFTAYALITIALGLLLLIYAWRRPRQLERLLLVILASMVIGKTVFLLPGIANDRVPERVVREFTDPVRVPGAAITSDVQAGTPLVPGENRLIQVRARTNGLTRVRLKAATYLHPTLEGFLKVSILAPDGELLREELVSGEHIKDLSWFPVDFDSITENYPAFTVRISGDYPATVPFSLWEDEDGNTLYETFYAFEELPY